MRVRNVYSPQHIMLKLHRTVELLHARIIEHTPGNARQDEEIERLIGELEDYGRQLVYSFLFAVKADGRLDEKNVEALEKLKEVARAFRNHAIKGIGDDRLLARVAKHVEGVESSILRKAMKEKGFHKAKEREAKQVVQKFQQVAKGHEQHLRQFEQKPA